MTYQSKCYRCTKSNVPVVNRFVVYLNKRKYICQCCCNILNIYYHNAICSICHNISEIKRHLDDAPVCHECSYIEEPKYICDVCNEPYFKDKKLPYSELVSKKICEKCMKCNICKSYITNINDVREVICQYTENKLMVCKNCINENIEEHYISIKNLHGCMCSESGYTNANKKTKCENKSHPYYYNMDKIYSFSLNNSDKISIRLCKNCIDIEQICSDNIEKCRYCDLFCDIEMFYKCDKCNKRLCINHKINSVCNNISLQDLCKYRLTQENSTDTDTDTDTDTETDTGIDTDDNTDTETDTGTDTETDTGTDTDDNTDTEVNTETDTEVNIETDDIHETKGAIFSRIFYLLF
jgi:hypothetical protein